MGLCLDGQHISAPNTEAKNHERFYRMNGITIQTQLNRPGRLTRLTLLLSLAFLLGSLFLFSLFRPPSTSAVPDRIAVETAIEERYGIHITMLAITAGGGVVDFRFQVVDPEKATNYMQGPYEELPVLIVEENGTRIDPRPHTHHINYEFGRTYYHIYRNPGGVVERGTSVTVVLGDLRLNNIIVR